MNQDERDDQQAADRLAGERIAAAERAAKAAEAARKAQAAAKAGR
ncbi:hypothetical protein ACFW1M_43875 [Streptomyces inhibens]